MSRSDDGYVHDPAEFDADDERCEDAPEREGESLEGVHPAAAEREFGRRGWVLVGLIVVAFVVSPLSILLWPPDMNYVVAFLILPLFPAFALAVAAVWATTRP